MKHQRYLAECLGAFTLTFAVWLSIATVMPFSTPVLAAATLGLFVYTIGGLSGAHLNPAVTLGLWSVKKINAVDAMLFVGFQLVGAILAMIVGMLLSGQSVTVPHELSLAAGIAEAMGAFLLAFGVSTAGSGKLHPAASGLVVGGSLFLGICIASPFSNAVLNPAVALGIRSFGLAYILGPIIGALAGVWAHRELFERPKARK